MIVNTYNVNQEQVKHFEKTYVNYAAIAAAVNLSETTLLNCLTAIKQTVDAS